jgi:hypothetical protein
MDEEAQEVERDILEHEQDTNPDSKNNMSFNVAELEEKGYTLQQAYRKIGGMGKENSHKSERSFSYMTHLISLLIFMT